MLVFRLSILHLIIDLLALHRNTDALLVFLNLMIFIPEKARLSAVINFSAHERHPTRHPKVKPALVFVSYLNMVLHESETHPYVISNRPYILQRCEERNVSRYTRSLSSQTLAKILVCFVGYDKLTQEQRLRKKELGQKVSFDDPLDAYFALTRRSAASSWIGSLFYSRSQHRFFLVKIFVSIHWTILFTHVHILLIFLSHLTWLIFLCSDSYSSRILFSR